MNKIYLNIIIILILTSCDFNQAKQNEIVTKNKKTEKNAPKETFYSRERIVYKYPNNVREEYIIYVTENKDTLFTQYKIFRNDVLDTLNSGFYNLELNKIGENTYSGRITLYSLLDTLKKSYSNHLTLSFFRIEKSFESKNQNFVEFKFKSKSDTIVGILHELRGIDTIINGEKMVQFIETNIPIDNKGTTNNPFIKGFDLLKKNER